MKITIYKCDLCGCSIEGSPFIITDTHNKPTKQVGCDIVLTPPGNRVMAAGLVLRVNAGFYCGQLKKGQELHFHASCIDTEVKDRILNFYMGEK